MPETSDNLISSKPGASARGLFSGRVMGRLVFAAACLATIIAAFYTEENWRGKRAWEACRRELEAKGASLDWQAHIPPAVPDEENMFKAPGISSWFVKDRAGDSPAQEASVKLAAMGQALQVKETNVIAEIQVVPSGGVEQPRHCDLSIECKGSGPDPGQLEQVRDALEKAIGLSDPNPGLSLDGPQGFKFVRHICPSGPLKVALRAGAVLSTTNVAEFFPRNFPALQGGNHLTVESTGVNTYRLLLSHAGLFAAADYLACSDLPEFGLMRKALIRRYARMEDKNNYQLPWLNPVPNFVRMRVVEQTLASRAQCDLLLGKPEAALSELTLVHDLCRLLNAKPTTLVAAMIHVAVSGMYSTMVADGLRLHAWREPELKVIEAELSENRLPAVLVDALENEQAGTCRLFETCKPAALEEIFSGQEARGLRRFLDPSFWELRMAPRGWVYQNMRTVAVSYQGIIETIDLTNNVFFPEKSEGVARHVFSTLNSYPPYTFLASAAIANFNKAVQTTARNQTLNDQALLACALERYRLAHGNYPETLAGLVPQFLGKLPHDLINGGEIKYQPRGGTSFVLYSIGWNGSDDRGVAGKSAAEGDWVWDQR